MFGALTRSRAVLAAFIFISLFSLLALFVFPPTTQAACYCVNPSDTGNGGFCSCTTSAASAGALYDASFAGVALRCDTPFEAQSLFATKEPVCFSGGWRNEVTPNCSYIVGDSSKLTCWGTGFSSFPENLSSPAPSFLDTRGWASWLAERGTAPVVFGGGSWDDGGNGVVDIYTCWENVTCCGLNCEQAGQGVVTSCADLGTGPFDPQYQNACAQGPVQPGGGEGESRLWFSQSRLIAALSTMAQSLFNPKGVNQYYDPSGSAFSNNSSESNRSSAITNETAFTTKIEQHQGLNDPTTVVDNSPNSTNNSSLIEGRGAPPPLYGFGNTADDNIYNDAQSCYIPNTRINPGDDLIGPKIKAELTFTQHFTYDAQPSSGCTGDGLPYTRAKDGSTTLECCSDIYIPDADLCRSYDPFNDDSCGNGTNSGYGLYCEYPPLSDTFFCCDDSSPFLSNQCTIETGICGTLQEVVLTAEGEVNVFTKTPMIEYIYNTIVTGAGSLYKRFMPYLGADPQFEEIPAAASFEASGNVASANSPVQFNIADGQTQTAVAYFPHIGSLDKYWLEDFQTSIRPQGFGRTTSAQQSTLPPSLGICNEAPGPFCDANSLLSDCNNDPTRASNASQICLQESGGNPSVINNDCQTGTGTYDFSVGLFQINLIAHCPQAFGPNTASPYCEIIDDGTDCSAYNSFARWPITNCNSELRACIDRFLVPANNINYMESLSRSCTLFSNDWSLASQACNLN